MEEYISQQQSQPGFLLNQDFRYDLFLKEFTIIIPAYNEGKRISSVLDNICRFISENNVPWNLIIAIDGNDETYDITRTFALSYDFITVNKSNGRRGKGGAIKRVLSEIVGEFTILMDADNSIDFLEVVRAVPFLNKSDVVILTRYSKYNRIPPLRLFLSRGFNILVRSLTGLKISDTQSGYKIFRTELFKASMQKVTVTNASYDVPLLYYIKKMGGRILEMPAHYTHADDGKLDPFSMAISFGISLVAFRIRNSQFASYIPKSLVRLYNRKFRWI